MKAPAPAVSAPMPVAAAVPGGQGAVEAVGLFALLFKPRFGVRVGAGNYDPEGTSFSAGADVTIKTFMMPFPAARFDVEGWSGFPVFGTTNRGNAISALAIFQAFDLAYAGIGPSYYRTSGKDDKSGIGAKALIGVSLMSNLYVEGSTVLGPKNPPLFISLGVRF